MNNPTKRKPLTETTTCYAVAIRRTDGSEFYSNWREATRALFWKRADAVAHANEVAEQLKWPRRNMRVVKVVSVIRETRKANP